MQGALAAQMCMVAICLAPLAIISPILGWTAFFYHSSIVFFCRLAWLYIYISLSNHVLVIAGDLITLILELCIMFAKTDVSWSIASDPQRCLVYCSYHLIGFVLHCLSILLAFFPCLSFFLAFSLCWFDEQPKLSETSQPQARHLQREMQA